jgi:hypothetical protein
MEARQPAGLTLRTAPMTTAHAQVATMIGAIRRHWLLNLAAWYGVTALAALLVWLLALVLADNFLILPCAGLVLGWLALGSGYALWMAGLGYRLTFGQPRANHLAILYELRVPGQHNRLVNAVDFLRSGQADRDPMARAALWESAQGLQPQTAALAIDRRPLRTALVAVTVGLVLFLGYSVLRPALVRNALERIFNPLHPPAHLLATSVRVLPGDIDIIEGQAVPISAELSHNLPAQAIIEYRVGHLGWTQAPMTLAVHAGSAASGTATYRYDQFKAIWQPVDYRILAGREAHVPVYHVTVQPRPRLANIQVSVTLPAYAGQAAHDLKPNTGDITALIGSTATIQVRASTALSAARIELSDGSQIPMRVAADGATATLPIAQSGTYAIRLTDTSTPEPLSNVNPPRFALCALEDQPPSAVITRPGRDLILPLDSSVELTIEAEDDVGLAWVELQARGDSGVWTPVRHWDFAALDVRQRTLSAALDLAPFKLKTGDVLLYRAVAADHHQPEPNVSVGRTWSISAAAAAGNAGLLGAEARRLLDDLEAILALQKEARADLSEDRPIDPLRAKQSKVRLMTLAVADSQRQNARPSPTMIDSLAALADGPEVRANDLLARYSGTLETREPLKAPALATMDQIIAKLEELVGKVSRSLALAERGQEAAGRLSPPDRAQALQTIHEVLDKLRQFDQQQQKVVTDSEELVRKAQNFTGQDLQKLDQLKGIEDKWADVFKGSVKDIQKLTEQGFADAALLSEYKQMVEQIEDAAKDLNPKITTLVVKREDVGRELAEKIAQDMEMWLPNTPDNTKWVLEEPLDKPDIPMPPLPDQLSDLIGDLIKQEDQMTEEADDQTSAWADSISAAGWGASDGPISNFSAKGVTGNQLPNNNELSGRAGDGRSGKSEGQMVGNEARGLEGRKTPTRVTNDTYEKGVVKELQQMATGGATGGGKMRGSGQEGLQGQTPPPKYDDTKMQYLKDWQQRLRQQAEHVAGQLRSVHIASPALDKAIAGMRQAEAQSKDGRYTEMFHTQQMVVQDLRSAAGLNARDTALQVDRAANVPAEQRRPILDAGDEPVPQEYHNAVRRYFENLSEDH